MLTQGTPTDLDNALLTRIRQHLEKLYPERADDALQQIAEVLQRHPIHSQGRSRWDERDVVLITYADQIHGNERTPLACLRDFLAQRGLDRLLRVVHLLPFSPYTSDDGFSIVDYRQVDPNAGTWQDVEALRREVDLMFDLVLNHVSQASTWFQGYLAGDERYAGWFHDVDPTLDLSQVTRPRSLPLLSPFETSEGKRHIWTTFSDDQIDLNYAEPAVLAEMLDILLEYVDRGARIVRLDAVAFLWKQIGTTCIHLPETHEVVKLLRTVLDTVAPSVIVLTETNVPHAENISYLGAGDEAHMVYQFSLPPLLLDAMLHEDAQALVRWLDDLEPAATGTTFFNFTASHDGIGVRPLEGLVPDGRVDQLADQVRRRGGHVSTRRQPDGSDTPYELNITWLDALGDPDGRLTVEQHARRVLTSQALMMALQGVPAVYFHTLVGTPNDDAGVEQTGRARSINRHKYDWDELNAHVDTGDQTASSLVFQGIQHLLEIRQAQPAFHPDAVQRILEASSSSVVAFLRKSTEPAQEILVLANLSSEAQTIALPLPRAADWSDLLGQQVRVTADSVELEPFQMVWLSSR